MALKLPIYLDYHATTPLDKRVLDEMLPYFTEDFGNAASRTHAFGWKAEAAVGVARERIAKMINADKPEEIIFTSGATESDNLALKGVAEFYGDKGKHIITSRIEHKAILDSGKRLEKMGFEVTYLDVDQKGFVDPEHVRAAIRPDTILCSVMLANNEVGTVQPIREIGAICREKGVLFHTDAVQGIGRVDFDVQSMNVDLASITAHKMYGPKGVGALYVRRSKPRVRLVAQMDGGGHERGYRSGTLNVPGIVGFGKAAEIITHEWRDEAARVSRLRDSLYKKITSALDEVFVNGPWPVTDANGKVVRLPNNLNISFAYVEGESILMSLKNVSVSSGSACTSASLEPSYVLRALGVEEELAHTSIRFGLGRFTTEEEVDFAADLTVTSIKRLRDLSPLYEMAKEGIDLKSIAWTAH
ncbi:MAG: IscS subfamily cysteine desulfurase [Myxococcales bacterium]|nr:IscS subfamily cysteine desulfurase [Myxococcales bacterium]